MKIIRCTLYTQEGRGPSAVMRQTDLDAPFDQVVEKLTAPCPPGFVVYDIFDMELPSILEATTEALLRMDASKQQDDNLAILYFWAIQQFGILSDRGVVQTTEPAPLPPDRLAYALRHVAANPAYRGQTVNLFTTDTAVSLRNGVVTTKPRRKHDLR